jgi:hypothetical protein
MARLAFVVLISAGWTYPAVPADEQQLAHAFACGYVFGRHLDSGYPLQSSCDDLADLAARHGFK